MLVLSHFPQFCLSSLSFTIGSVEKIIISQINFMTTLFVMFWMVYSIPKSQNLVNLLKRFFFVSKFKLLLKWSNQASIIIRPRVKRQVQSDKWLNFNGFFCSLLKWPKKHEKIWLNRQSNLAHIFIIGLI